VSSFSDKDFMLQCSEKWPVDANFLTP